MTKKESTKLVNFMTPGASVLLELKWPYCVLFIILYSQAQIRQMEYIVLMSKEVNASIKIVNFKTSKPGVLVYNGLAML